MSKLSKSIRGIFGVLRFSAGNASVFSDRLMKIELIILKGWPLFMRTI
jgi:hypothetical protein